MPRVVPGDPSDERDPVRRRYCAPSRSARRAHDTSFATRRPVRSPRVWANWSSEPDRRAVGPWWVCSRERCLFDHFRPRRLCHLLAATMTAAARISERSPRSTNRMPGPARTGRKQYPFAPVLVTTSQYHMDTSADNGAGPPPPGPVSNSNSPPVTRVPSVDRPALQRCHPAADRIGRTLTVATTVARSVHQ